MIRNKNEDGFVYVFRAGKNFYKIGKTSKTVKERLTTLRAMCPLPMKCFCVLRTRQRNLHKLERYMQSKFLQYHLWGEWFQVPRLSIVRQILDDAQLEFTGNKDVYRQQLKIASKLHLPSYSVKKNSHGK